MDTQDLLNRYGLGESLESLMHRFGLSFYRLKAVLTDINAPKRKRRGKKRIVLPTEILSRYQSGESEKSLAIKFGVDRDVIRRHLLEAGIKPRGRSSAMYVRMERTSKAERERITAAAHKANIGRKRTFRERLNGAIGNERRKARLGKWEQEFAAMLRARGINAVVQQAVGPYNCDLGAFPIAVEITRGGQYWHSCRSRHCAKRLRYFTDRGWSMVVVAIPAKGIPTERCADHVATYIKKARRNPTFRRKHWVVRGDIQSPTWHRIDGNKFSAIATLCRAPNGRYFAEYSSR